MNLISKIKERCQLISEDKAPESDGGYSNDAIDLADEILDLIAKEYFDD